MMRVLRLCSVFEPPASALVGKGASFDPIGGMQNHTAELTRALDRRGVVQTVVTTRPPTAPHLQRLGNHARVIRLGLPIKRFRQLYGVQAGLLAPVLASKVDLVHLHLGEDLAILPVGMAAAKLHRLPLVLTIHMSLRHTLVLTDFRSVVLKALGGPVERWGERSADAVLAITPRLAQMLLSEGVGEKRVRVIPPGVNSALFASPHDDPFPWISRPRVVFVGRLAPQKGVRTLVTATSMLENAGAQILLVGDGPERPALEREIRRLGVENRVHLLGFVQHEHVPAVLAYADLLVLPSLYEELGTVLLEAMWLGRPIVASRTGGIPDVVTHGVSGLLVPPGDPEALACAIDRVLSSPDLAHQLGEAAREQAKDYDWEVLAERVLEAYRDVTASRS
jgi:glycogen(starch) synthase